MTQVRLTWHEAAEACREGCHRRLRRLARGRTDRYGWDPHTDEWGNDIDAAGAELAFAKHMGLYWAPSDKPDYKGDVGNWQIRSSRNEGANLIVYPDDADYQHFVLVLGKMPDYRIVGCMLGGDAKRPEWEAGSRLRVPAYLVPQDVLSPLVGSLAA